MRKPLVSISCITFNHGPFIRDCLEGFLMQNCNFEFEVLIHDDASTDETQDIIKEYELKHPNIFKPIYQLENQWSKGVRGINLKYNFSRAKGKYIALCEGDDYWTDPYKLQKQVDILEQNDDCILVTGGFKSIYPDGKEEDYIATIESHSESKGFFYTLDDLSKVWLTKTLTAVFRNKKSIFTELEKYTVSYDTHLFYHLLKEGKGYYFKHVLGVYNRHDGGISSSLSEGKRKLIRYKINKEIYEKNKDNYSRKNYVIVSMEVLNDKISFRERNPRIKLNTVFFTSLKLMKSKAEISMFFKCLIPQQFKDLFKQ